MKAGYSPRVDALLERLGSDLTEQDFADLALACADQAGVNGDDQDRIGALVGANLMHDGERYRALGVKAVLR